MKYVLSAILALLIAIGPVGAQAPATASPNVGAPSAVLMDAVTGQVLWARNKDVKRPMASTTKIMTAILAIENLELTQPVVASKRASETPFTSLHLKPGEKVDVENLLRALLIRSANDTAVALAEKIGDGSVEKFAVMMNDKAREIGCENTHFVTPNGLYAPNHYTTAHDLALIARYATQYPEFNRIVAMRSSRIERSMNKQDIVVRTNAKFLKCYPGADGIKSGYIKQAGHCYVGSATKGGWRLISVVLKSPNSQADTTALMDYGFASFERVILQTPKSVVTEVPVSGGQSKLPVVVVEPLQAVVRKGEPKPTTAVKIEEKINAPVRKGDKVGTMTAYIGDRAVSTVDLEAAEDVHQTVANIAWPWVRTMLLVAMFSIGVAGGRAAAKGPGVGRRRFS
jgi:D-alanyl-D-alanine carboxypeptidase (penicillin-binding protein 5/6)